MLTDCQYSQRTSICGSFNDHCILLGAATRTPWLPKPFKCNVGDNARPPYESDMHWEKHGCARDGACPSPLEVHVSQPGCRQGLAATRPTLAACTAHLPIRDVTTKSGLAPLCWFKPPFFWAIQDEYRPTRLSLAQFYCCVTPPLLARYSFGN